MLAVALSPNTTNASSISSKIAGIVLANISSGFGEVSFLGLTHYYGPLSLAAWVRLMYFAERTNLTCDREVEQEVLA